MANLSRKYVRNQAAALIVAAATPAGPRVFAARDLPLDAKDQANFPAVCVYTPAEKLEIKSLARVMAKSSITLLVDCYTGSNAATEAADDLDDLLDAALAALLCNEPFLRLFELLTSIDLTTGLEWRGEGDLAVGRITIEGRSTSTWSPAVPVEDFGGVNANLKVSPTPPAEVPYIPVSIDP